MGPIDDLAEADREFDDTNVLDASGEPDCDDSLTDWYDLQTSEE